MKSKSSPGAALPSHKTILWINLSINTPHPAWISLRLMKTNQRVRQWLRLRIWAGVFAALLIGLAEFWMVCRFNLHGMRVQAGYGAQEVAASALTRFHAP